MRWLLFLFLLLLSPSPGSVVHAQAEVDPDTTYADSIRIQAGTLFAPSIEAFPQSEHKTKSPGKAMLFSALVPGAGQLYNESYWKVPIVVGFGVYFASQWLHNHRLYKDYRDQYTRSLLDPSTNPLSPGRLQSLREFYRDQRDTFTWYLAILYFVNVADAYVDASLYDFNVSSDLSIRLIPLSNGVAVQMAF